MLKHAFSLSPSRALFPGATPPAHRNNGGLTVEIALDAPRAMPLLDNPRHDAFAQARGATGSWPMPKIYKKDE